MVNLHCAYAGKFVKEIRKEANGFPYEVCTFSFAECRQLFAGGKFHIVRYFTASETSNFMRAERGFN